jgi:hypothetical protein
VSRLAPPERSKGLDYTLHALAILRRGGTSVELDVVGDGDDRGRLEAVAAAEGIRAAVRFHGALDAAALGELYARADLFVLPSGSEGFGLVYLEAMAHARPVVAADALTVVRALAPAKRSLSDHLSSGRPELEGSGWVSSARNGIPPGTARTPVPGYSLTRQGIFWGSVTAVTSIIRKVRRLTASTT